MPMNFEPTELPVEKEVICRRLVDGTAGRVFVLGRNKYADSVASTLDVEGFLDDYTREREYLGRPVLRLADVPAGATVVSCVVDGRPVTAVDRVRQSFADRWLEYFALTRFAPDRFRPIDFSAWNRRDILENRAKYTWLHARLADEESRTTLERVTRFRLTWDLEAMRGFVVDFERQYFEAFAPFTGGDVFVDGGGFDGQTTCRFVTRCPEYRRVYYFEPGPDAMERSRGALTGLRDIVFVQKGLFNRGGVVSFDDTGGPTSRIASDGGVVIPVTRLDDELSEVSFLKLDVEGAEVHALKGARERIRANHPTIAACVYHDQRHFWQIPELVLGLREDYAVYLRHYTEGVFETVMYFVPRRSGLG